ncbi:UvrD-helicase domain-containing protein [Paenibacillus silagei]|uniref:DNA 3'-5' helicase n=1 Tax=Paenibacillus silagei TaxID=1670801 RepID=A0ABS4NVJ3_9BACL|nr:UvrD-helicase domain-containing protein [Paenibacillus silagei]MBP2114079.1 ATP-dependent helicase/nuclease subunit A [Paenibacillus silagei]
MVDDQTARERIAGVLDRTLMVEAGAGSGKTTSLVGRMIALIESGSAVAEQIAAITFTRKAADELKSRFRLELERRIRKAIEPQKALLQRALQEIDRCYIGTIHSFCGRLLRERPIEARLDPMFREIEEDEASLLQDQCWDEYLVSLIENGKGDRMTDLASLQVNVEDLRQVYKRVCGYTDVHIETVASSRPNFDLIRLSLPQMIAEAGRYIPTQKPAQGWDALQAMVRDGKRLLILHGLDDDMRILQLALIFERKINVTLNRWTDSAMAKEYKVMFLEWQIRVLFPFLGAWREYLYPQLIDFVSPAVDYGAHKRNELGVLDFQDLLMRATALLREHEHVRRFFAARYTRLFVDEFQDTDPIQAELMFLLTGDDPREADWRRITPKPGSLFIVGDPKQSIYRFRRADISTYNWVKNKISSCGEVLQLSANFRSIHHLGQFTNDEFNARFPQAESEHQAAFVHMDTRTTNPENGVQHGVYTMTHAKMAGGQAAIAEADASRAARYIAWACSGQLKIQEKQPGSNGGFLVRDATPSDFLVLLKRKDFLHLYAAKLEQYGVPSVTTGSSAIYEEIDAIAVLASCLNDPGDPVALLAVLKGMLFSVSDNALFHYKMQGFPITYTTLPNQAEVGEIASPVYEALVRLAEYAEMIRKLPALSALLSIIEDMGMISLAAVRQTGRARAGTLIKLLHLLHKDSLVAASWPELSEYLMRVVKEAKLECGDLFAGEQDAVRIMNLHKAKGLEAPVVLLACPCGESDHDAGEHVDRMGDSARGYFSITRRRGYQEDVIAHPPGWQELAERERLYMNAEKERLLYVAATRAKQLMIISRYPDRPAIDPWSSFECGILEGRELNDPEVISEVPSRYEGAHDETADENNSRQWRSRLAQPTYQTASVTKLAKSGAVQPPRPLAGRGMAFGSVVHRCIELLGTGAESEQMELHIRMIAEEEGMDEALIPDVQTILDDVVNHPLWRRALAAKRRIHELPLRTVRADIELFGEDSIVGSEAKTLYLKGVIDFLFEEEEGWVVVDFKTDVYEEGQQAAFVEFYRPQVVAYRRELEIAFGMKVQEAVMYFLHRNEYVSL